MHQHIATINKIRLSAYPRLAVLLPVRCVRVLHSRVPPTPVSQTGEAELAAREIAPQICGHLRLPGTGTLALEGRGTLAGVHGPGPRCGGCAVTV